MFTIEFYKKTNQEKSELEELLDELYRKSDSSKDARIKFKAIKAYIDLLGSRWPRLSEIYVKKMNNNWENYKNKIRADGKKGKQLMLEADLLTKILEVIVDKRVEMNLSQRDLARLCKVPQSTIARIEKMNVSPNLDTLFKILEPLGLTLQIVNA